MGSILAAWLAVVGAGMARLFIFARTPGEAARASPKWPTASRLPRSAERPTLLVFAHPDCPCSAATLGELERLLPRINGRAQTIVVFSPGDQSAAQTERDLFAQARRMPGVTVVFDDDDREAHAFDAQTSGQTFLYAADGRLAFSGGITPLRGHSGDSKGREEILAFFSERRGVASAAPGAAHSLVFGCALHGPSGPERAL